MCASFLVPYSAENSVNQHQLQASQKLINKVLDQHLSMSGESAHKSLLVKLCLYQGILQFQPQEMEKIAQKFRKQNIYSN